MLQKRPGAPSYRNQSPSVNQFAQFGRDTAAQNTPPDFGNSAVGGAPPERFSPWAGLPNPGGQMVGGDRGIMNTTGFPGDSAPAAIPLPEVAAAERFSPWAGVPNPGGQMVGGTNGIMNTTGFPGGNPPVVPAIPQGIPAAAQASPQARDMVAAALARIPRR